MTQSDRIEIANQVWGHCQERLLAETAAKVKVIGGGAEAFDKNSKGSSRLRIQPKEKIPAGFWKGWRWFEVHVGALPGKSLIGGVGFIFGAHLKGGEAAPFADETRRILREAATTLGNKFSFEPGNDKSVIALWATYKGNFPPIEAGEDLARLIESTLPRLQAIVHKDASKQ